MLIFVLLFRVCIHLIMVILARRIVAHVRVVLEGVYKCRKGM